MPIQDFQQQSLRAQQGGMQLGSALRNAQAMQEQQAFEQQMQPLQLQQAQQNIMRTQQDTDYQSQLRPMQLQQQQLQNQAMEQENLSKGLAQDAILLSSLSEEDGKKVIPQLINKYEGNESVIAGFNKLYKSTGQEYISNNLRAVAAFTGKPIGGKEKPAGLVEFEAVIQDFTPEQQKNAKLIRAGLKGRAMSNALMTAIESGDVTNLAQAKAEIKQAEKFGELTGSSRAKAIDKGFESITKIDNGIGNIDRAIAALDKGAGVGALEKFWPSIKAASVELDNIRGQMALDVVGSTTFGALSEGELNLAKDIALPTGLDTAELKVYLIEKKAAQEKLKAYYNEQIQFLDQGGTVAGFLRSKTQGQQQPATPAAPVPAAAPAAGQAPDAALQMLSQNPNLAEQFKAKFGYLPEGF